MRNEATTSPRLYSARRHSDSGNTVTSEAPRQCKPEFSMDKMIGDNKVLTARCRWDGTLSVSTECQNSDGCVGNRCGSHGVCRNKAIPMVVHLNDYTCECDSGFVLESPARDGEICHTCENVQVCPWWKACVPGICVDEIYGYSCS